MTTVPNMPTLAELRARKAAATQTAGGMPTLAELRARKAARVANPVDPVQSQVDGVMASLGRMNAPTVTRDDSQAPQNPYRTIPGAAPAIPAAPEGFVPGQTPALNAEDIPVIGPIMRLNRVSSQTPGEAAYREYNQPTETGVRGFATEAVRMAKDVATLGVDAPLQGMATGWEATGGPLGGAGGAAISAAMNIARIPGAEKLGRLIQSKVGGATGAMLNPVVRGAASGVVMGETQAGLESGLRVIPKAAQAADQGAEFDAAMGQALLEEWQAFKASQPGILTAGALGGAAGDVATDGIASAIAGRARAKALARIRDLRSAQEFYRGQAGPNGRVAEQGPAIGAAASRGQTNQGGAEPVGPSPSPTEAPNQGSLPRAAIAQTMSAATPEPVANDSLNPAPKDFTNGQEKGRQEGLLSQQPPEPPVTPAAGVSPIRSGDRLTEGETVTDTQGRTFTVGPTLDSGRVVLTGEGGRKIQRTSGEMEARGWTRFPGSKESSDQAQQLPSVGPDRGSRSGFDQPNEAGRPGRQAEPRPSDAQLENRPGLVRSESQPGEPIANSGSSPNPTAGRVGPPPAEVANPPSKPKGVALDGQVSVSDGQKSANSAKITLPDTVGAQDAPPRADTPGYLDRVIQWAETKSKEGRAARPADAKGARFGGTTVNRYDVVAAAAKAVRAGVRTVAKIREIVTAHLGREDPDATRQVVRLVRSAEVGGRHDDARFELAVADILDTADAPTPKQTIRENTGQTRNETDTITQREALKGQLQAEAKGAARVDKERRADHKAAVKALDAKETEAEKRVQNAVDAATNFERQSADIREGMATAKGKRLLSEQAEKLRAERQAQREAFIDKIEEGQKTRDELLRIAREELEPADRAKVLSQIAKGATEGDLVRGIKRILDVQKTAADRKALKELRKTVGKASAPKSEENTIAREALKELNASLGVSKPTDPYRGGRITASDIAKLRTEYRDALSPAWEAVGNGNATGVDKLADFIKKKTEDGRSNAFDADGLELLRSATGKPLDELDAEQLRVVKDAIQHVRFLSDNENKMQFLGERRDLEQVREEVRGDVRARWGTKEATDIGDGTGFGQGAKDFLVTDQDTLSTMIGAVAGRDSTAHKIMYEGVAKGESDKIRFRRELLKDAQLDKWSPADIANANKKRELKYSGGKVSLTGAEMIDIVGLWNDPNTRPEIEKAGLVLEADRGTIDRKFFLNEADVSAIEMAMTPKERAAVDVIQKALKKGYTAANDAHEQMNGFRLPDSDKHWSRRRDISATEREVSGELGKDGQGARWIEDSGIFKDRSTTKAAVVVRNALEWVPDQLDTLAGMAHLAIPMRNARRVMADPQVKTEFTRKGGKNWVREFEGRLAEASGGVTRDRAIANKVGQRLLGFLARNRLAWRVSTIAKQKLGFLQAAASVKDLGHAARIVKQAGNILNYSRGVRKKLRAEIDTRSGYLAERADAAMSAMLASAASPNLRVATTKIGRLWQAGERVGLSGLQWADADVVLGTYVATKQHLAKTKGLAGDALKDAAVWETEKIIRDSQNPTSTLDMSGFNMSGRKNPWLGSLTMFTSSANKVRNQLRQAASDYAADRSKANAVRLASTTVLSVANSVGSRAIGLLLSGATLSQIVAMFSGADLDEREVTLQGEAIEAGAELIDTLVPLGAGGDVVRWVGGRPTYSIPGGVVNFLSRASKAAQAVTEDGMDAQTVRKILKAARASQALPDAPIDYTEKIIRGIAGDE